MSPPSLARAGMAVAALSLSLSACGGSTPRSPHDGAPPARADDRGLPPAAGGGAAGALLTRTATASPVDLRGRWTLQPAFSVDPVLDTEDLARRAREREAAARNQAGFRGRRGRFSGRGFGGGGFGGGRGLGSGAPGGGRSRGTRANRADPTAANLGDATVIGAQALTIVMTGDMATIERDDGSLVARRQFWDGQQLVVVRNVSRRLVVERYTLSPDRARLHVAIQTPSGDGEPSTFIRQFEQAAPTPRK